MTLPASCTGPPSDQKGFRALRQKMCPAARITPQVPFMNAVDTFSPNGCTTSQVRGRHSTAPTSSFIPVAVLSPWPAPWLPHAGEVLHRPYKLSSQQMDAKRAFLTVLVAKAWAAVVRRKPGADRDHLRAAAVSHKDAIHPKLLQMMNTQTQTPDSEAHLNTFILAVRTF